MVIATLEDLVAPLSEGEFRDMLRARRLYFRRGDGENRYAGLLDWETMRDALASGTFPLKEMRVTGQERRVAPAAFLTNGKPDAAKLDALMTIGGSILASPLEPQIPHLKTLCDAIGDCLSERVYIGGVVTSGPGGAAPLHYDKEDNIVLQMEGSKRWSIYGDPVANPVEHMPDPPLPAGEPIFDEVLRPGDFLFVPAGYWHHCENQQKRSLHVGVLMLPPSAWEATYALVLQLLGDEAMRAPLTRFANAEARAAHEEAIRSLVSKRVQQMSIEDLIAARRHR